MTRLCIARRSIGPSFRSWEIRRQGIRADTSVISSANGHESYAFAHSGSMPKARPTNDSASSAISARSCSFLAAQPPVGEPDRIDLRDGLMHVLARAEDQGELSPDADLASMADFFEEGNVAMAHMKMHPLSRGLLASIISLVPR